MGLLSTNLAEFPVRPAYERKLAELSDESKPPAEKPSKTPSEWARTAKTWVVFLLCLALTLVGVVVSFVVFGTTITGTRKWGVAVVVSIVMLGLSYGAKYSNESARDTFTPVDALQYLSQAFLWPSTWPALADLVGIQKVEPPIQSHLLEHTDQLLIFAWLLLN